MLTVSDLLGRIEPLASTEGYDAIERFLTHPATHIHTGGSDGRVTVKTINHAWATRLDLALKKGIMPPPGCEHLVQSLARLPATAMLTMVAMESADQLGAMWFLEETGEPVGFVVGSQTAAIGPEDL